MVKQADEDEESDYNSEVDNNGGSSEYNFQDDVNAPNCPSEHQD